MALAADTTGKCVVSCGRKRTSRVLMTFWHALKLSCLNTFFVADLSHHYDDVDSNRAAAAPTAASPFIIHPSGSICFQTLVVYFNLDLVTGLEIAVDCFVTVSLEQLVPRADRMDPVLAYNNLRWHSLDRRGRNHLSDGLHRKLDLVSSTHYGKAKAEDGYCYEVAYSVHNIRVFERALACRRTKPTPPFGRSLSNRRLDLRP